MTKKILWVLGMILGLLVLVLPWSLFLFGAGAIVMKAVLACSCLALCVVVAFIVMRKKIPMLGQGNPTRKQWIIGCFWGACTGATALLAMLLGSEASELIWVFGFYTFAWISILYLREAKYWFAQKQALQTENEDLKRRLGSSI